MSNVNVVSKNDCGLQNLAESFHPKDHLRAICPVKRKKNTSFLRKISATILIEHSDINEKSGFNYLEITGLGQGYMINENALVHGGRCTGNCLNYLEIQMTRFNFAQGKLYPERASVWVDGLERYKEVRTEINVDDLDVPIRAKLENTIHEGTHQYVKFSPTSIDKDVAQTIVPFLDVQDVVPSSPMALRGAGLYYKSTPGYGGFVGLKVLTYDPSIHFSNSDI